MQAPRFTCWTEVQLSQASQLPQLDRWWRCNRRTCSPDCQRIQALPTL